MSTVQVPHRTRKTQKRKASATPAVSADRVREMLREIAFVLHATRVARRVDESVAAKKSL